MLKAQKNIWFDNVFSLYNRNLVHRRFNSLNISNFNELSNRNKLLPLIIYLNHSCWWDGLVAFEISRRARLESYIMMEERQLKTLFLFRRLGAFSVSKENPRLAMESINYAAKVLREDYKRVLWIFPQGEILPNDKRPLCFYNGLSKIIKKFDGEIQLLPIAIRYEFLGHYKPEIFIKIDQVELITPDDNFEPKKLTQKLSVNLTRLLDQLKLETINQDFIKFENLI